MPASLTWQTGLAPEVTVSVDRDSDSSAQPASLRLLLVNYEFPPIGGGASFASAGLARTLVERGHRVDVLTSRLRGQPESEWIDGVHVHRVRSWRYGQHECGIRGAATFLVFALLRLRRLLATERYDLVHYFFGLPCGVLSLYTHGRHGIPYIVSLRGSDVPGYDSTDRPLSLSHWLLSGLSRRIWRNARFVIPNSVALRDLAAAFEPGIEYEVVPNAVDTGTPRSRSASPDERVQLLCVARLIERKGIDVLLAAFARLRSTNAVLHIVGSGRDEQQLRRLAATMGITERVVFHGAMNHADVQRMYRAADVFVLPTLSESCSMALLEAMSAGLPVVTTRVGGNLQLIQEGHNGLLVTPGDVQALTEALDALVTDAARREAMGQANITRIANEFTWSINAERYERVYRQSLAETTTQSP